MGDRQKPYVCTDIMFLDNFFKRYEDNPKYVGKKNAQRNDRTESIKTDTSNP